MQITNYQFANLPAKSQTGAKDGNVSSPNFKAKVFVDYNNNYHLEHSIMPYAADRITLFFDTLADELGDKVKKSPDYVRDFQLRFEFVDKYGHHFVSEEDMFGDPEPNYTPFNRENLQIELKHPSACDKKHLIWGNFGKNYYINNNKQAVQVAKDMAEYIKNHIDETIKRKKEKDEELAKEVQKAASDQEKLQQKIAKTHSALNRINS